MIKSYSLKHEMNKNKEIKIIQLFKEYRKTRKIISKNQWKLFYFNKNEENFSSNFNKMLDIKNIKSKSKIQISQRYKQTIQYQVVGILDSYFSNIQNEFKEIIYKSSLNEEDKKTLFIINKYKCYFNKNDFIISEKLDKNGKIIHKKKILPIHLIKFSRKIIKHLINKNTLPNMNYIQMNLDNKVMEIKPKTEIFKDIKQKNKWKNKRFKLVKLKEKLFKDKKTCRKSFDYWINLSSLIEGEKIFIPLKSNKYFKKQSGILKNFVQINLKEDKKYFNNNNNNNNNNSLIEINLLKEQNKDSIKKVKELYLKNTKLDKIGIDLGLVNLFSTSEGDLFGRNFNKKLYYYDEIIQKITKNRQKSGLKTKSKKYIKITNKLKSYLKNEINRNLNKIIKIHQPKKLILERLNFQGTNLSRRMNRILSNFGKGIIKQKLEQLNKEFGIEIEEINPRYTSQECNYCGFVSKENRKTQDKFSCISCNLKLNINRYLFKNNNKISKNYIKIEKITELKGKKKYIKYFIINKITGEEVLCDMKLIQKNRDINRSKNILRRSSSQTLKNIYTKRIKILEELNDNFFERNRWHRSVSNILKY